MHLVTRNHFRSRNKDGIYTIRSAIAENPMLHANFITMFYRNGVTAAYILTLSEYRFWTFLLLWP